MTLAHSAAGMHCVRSRLGQHSPGIIEVPLPVPSFTEAVESAKEKEADASSQHEVNEDLYSAYGALGLPIAIDYQL